MTKIFYIPTTTLNFNNILSCESISPKSFYSNRNFGYGRWVLVNENPEENVTFLYEEPYSFERPQGDLEDHPLLIEVNIISEVYSKFKEIEKGIYSFNETIYITPWDTKFIFFSERHQSITLSMSESSLETKLVQFYSKKYVVSHTLQPKKNRLKPVTNSAINNVAIENDIHINKLKGLLYGYYIGALLSCRKEDVIKLNALLKIKNIFISILSTSTTTKSQKEELTLLFEQLNNSHPLYSKLRCIVENEQKFSQVIELLNSYTYIEGTLSLQLSLDKLHNNNEDDVARNSQIIWINNEIEKQKNRILSTRKLLQTKNDDIIVSEKKIVKINFVSNSEQELFKAWINNLLISKEYNGKISTLREDLSDQIALNSKELYKDKWNDSYVRIFLNKLRRHIRGDNFDVIWDNNVLPSLAAVLTNGDNWTKLLSFMQQKEMTDYRLSFALYGVLNGFANLTRDFTDIILSCDKAYVADVYKEFYGQLFGLSVNIENAPNQHKEDNITYNHVSDDGKTSNETSQALDINPNNSSHKLCSDNYPVEADIEMRQRLEAAIKDGIKADAKKGDAIMAILIANNGNWQSTIDKIESDEKLKLGNKTINNIRRAFNISTNQNCKSKGKSAKECRNKKGNNYEDCGGNNLFTDIIHQHSASTFLWNDDGLWSNIQLLFDNKNITKAKEDVIWFQKEFRKGDQSAYYSKARRDNYSIIGKFENYLKKKEYVNEQTLKRIIEKIKSIYK
ncbi:MAG: hypothetical protein RR061_08805 [Muribaculaceae bacterium]